MVSGARAVRGLASLGFLFCLRHMPMLTFIDMMTTQRGRPAPSAPPMPADAAHDDVLNAMGAVVIEMDAEGRIQLMNRACERLAGDSIDEMAGQDIRMLFANPEEMHVLTRGFEALRAGDVKQVHVQMHWTRDDASPRLLEGTCTARYDAQGRAEALVLVGIDVTERRGLERDLTTLNTAERRSISESLHETLGMDLAATAMQVQNLKRAVENGEPCGADDLAAIADAIRSGVGRARELSHELMPVSLQQDRLSEALVDLAHEQDMQWPGTCTFLGDPDLPPVRDTAVAMHLYRIAQEAVTNARVHASPNHIAIRLRASTKALTLSIHNDGPAWRPDKRMNQSSGKGIARMQYRAHLIGAALNIAHLRETTTVTCRLPLYRLKDAEAV